MAEPGAIPKTHHRRMDGGILLGHVSTRAHDAPVSPRRAPSNVLGGSLTRAANGDLVISQTTNTSFPSPKVVQELWARTSRQRYPEKWDGIDPDGAVLIYFTNSPIKITCGQCHTGLGDYRAYNVGGEFGIVFETSREYRSSSTLSPETRADSPHQRVARQDPRFHTTERSKANSTSAHFRCSCRRRYERNLRRLGKHLWETRPETYLLE